MLKKIGFLLFFVSVFAGNAQEAYTYFSKGHNYIGNDKDSAYFYFNKMIDLADQTDQLKYLLSGYIYLLYANGIYFDLDNYQKNLERLGNILTCDPRMDNYGYKEYYQRSYIFSKGNYNFKIGSYKKAKKYFNQLLKSIPKKEWGESQRIHSILSFLATIYHQTGKTELAKTYYHKTLSFLKTYPKSNSNWKSKSAVIQLSLAKLSQQEGKYAIAEEIIHKALSFYETGQGGKGSRNSMVSAYHLLANNYLLQKKPGKALKTLEEMERKNQIVPKNLKFLKAHQKYKARAFAQKEEYNTALQFYQKAIETTENYYHTEYHPDIAKLHKEIGELYADQEKFKRGLASFQKALSALSKDFKSETFFDNPKPNKVLSKLSLIKVLAAKQQTLAEAFEAENDLAYLKAANQTAKSLVETLDALKPNFETKVDFQFLLEETFPAFDQMMQTAFLLHQKTGDKTYLNDAFYFTEKSKAVLLLSAVQNTGADQFSGVPGSLVEKEQQYRAKINHFEKKGFKNPNDEVLKDELFDLKNEFYAFLDRIENKYPNYHQLKFSTQVVGLAEIQNLLHSGEVLLEYYAAEGFLYCFLVEKEKTKLLQIPLSENFSKKITRLQKLLSTPSVLEIEKLKDLSDKIRKKTIPEISPSVSKLVIARSGLLNYIPFGALYDTKEKAYLIENYAVSYANSATLYREYAKEPVSENHKILAFAPGFENPTQSSEASTASPGPLLHNRAEVEKIANYFEGKILTDDSASLRVFQDSAKKFGILHLATHAIINDQFPDYSYLAFAPKDSTNLLYIKDLYNYRLNANLVVLSACETGTGKLQKGAGILSLARGFNYAGANALVTTQWKINDQSSANLMENFYKNLSKGQSKNTALREAKLRYLKTTDDAMQRHPYYWAGFVLSGNTSPVAPNPDSNLWIYLSVIILIFMLFVGFFIRRKKVEKNR